jgi:hypothetical protein
VRVESGIKAGLRGARGWPCISASVVTQLVTHSVTRPAEARHGWKPSPGGYENRENRRQHFSRHLPDVQCRSMIEPFVAGQLKGLVGSIGR